MAVGNRASVNPRAPYAWLRVLGLTLIQWNSIVMLKGQRGQLDD